MVLFKFLSQLLIVPAWLVMWVGGIFRKSFRIGMAQRLGRIDPQKKTTDPGVIICCASVGEVVTAAPFIEAYHNARPAVPIFIATSSPSGKQEAKSRLGDFAVCLLRPLELGFCPARWLDKIGAGKVILMETELWPLFLWECNKRGLDLCMISGRISDRSLPSYKMLSFIFKPLLARFKAVAVQNETYKKRFILLGADPDVVKVTGNLKFSATKGVTKAMKKISPVMTEFSEGSRMFVAGSTHSGEEQAVLDAFLKIAESHADAKLLIAPRHIERTAEVERLVEKTGMPYALRTRWESGKAPRIMILDTLGELAGAFRFATVSFIGGSLMPVGGHNVLEPARFAVPVLFGPHVENFAEEALLLEQGGGAFRLDDPAALSEKMSALYDDPAQAFAMGEKGKAAFDSIQGVLANTLDWVIRSNE